MKNSSIRYLTAYIIPISAVYSFYSVGYHTFSTVILAFGIIPFIELFIKPIKSNISELDFVEIKNNPTYSWIIYLAVPVQLYCLVTFFEVVTIKQLSIIELIGMTTAMGTMCGVFGINIAHELGHRSNRYEQLLSEILLLTSLENHFLPYHNFGHHLNVGTKKDPATARIKESVYMFWFRSHITGYIQAWKIEKQRSMRKGTFLSNRMVWYTFIQMLLLSAIGFIYGSLTLILFLCAAAFGIILLETVNYIEHYGLKRNLKDNGKPERVQPEHSWNSDHILGRLVLFELSRHSDHHYLASKPYQILESYPNSPQMPSGYPGMMLLSLFPPLWYKIMHKRLEFNT